MLITLTVSRYRCAAILTDRDGIHQRELPAFDLGTLACHGEQNPADPAQAALMLADGRLQVTDITTRAVHHAEGAYLSECQPHWPG